MTWTSRLPKGEPYFYPYLTMPLTSLPCEVRLPNRIIRESCRTSATLYRLSDGAERMFWRLTTVADDFGRFEADPQILKSQCFPLWPEARLKISRVREWLTEMVKAELVTLYLADGKALGYFPTWEKYQTRRAKTSKYPAPTDANICARAPANVPVFVFEESRNRGIEESSRTADAVLPRPHVNGTDNGQAPKAVTFRIPDSIVTALDRAPRFGDTPRLRDPRWWQAIVRAYPGVDYGQELLEAESWCRSNPTRAPKKDNAAFLYRWLRRAAQDLTV